MPMFRPTSPVPEHAMVEHACPPAPIKRITRSATMSSLVGVGGSGPVDSDTDDTTVDVFDDETVGEILEATLECGLEMMDHVGHAKRMCDGYWDEEGARRYYIASKIDSVLTDVKVFMNNMVDARSKVLRTSTMDELKREYDSKSYLNADVYMMDDDGVAHHEVFNVVKTQNI